MIAKPANAYLPHVDGLRGIAILAVVVFHAFPSVLPGGFIGVDVFFVISGFLITGLVLREIEAGTFTFRDFFVRRIRRLAPAVVVMLLATTIAATIILMPDALVRYGRSLAATAALHANYYFLENSGYFDGASHAKPLLHMWSLAVEEQFYLVWPLVLVVLARRGRALLIATAILFAASLAHAHYEASRLPAFAFFSLSTRAYELLVGAVLAVLVKRHDLARIASGPATQAFGFVGLGLIAASMLIVDGAWTFPGLSALPACIGSALVIFAGLGSASPVGRAVAVAPLRLLGLVSYSLYLWHWPVIALATYRLERPPSTIEMSALIFASLALATVSLIFVERPFRLAGGSRSALAAFSAAAVATIAFVFAGFALRWSDGLPQRFDEGTQALLSGLERRQDRETVCSEAVGKSAVMRFGACRTGGETTGTLLLAGDSNALHFVPFFAEAAARRHLVGTVIGSGGCPPLLDYINSTWNSATARRCQDLQRRILEFVEANPSLRAVAIAARWPRQAGQGRSSAAEQVLAARLQATIDVFRARGLEVLVIDQIPDFADVLPSRCALSARQDESEKCGLARRDAEARMAIASRILERVVSRYPGGVHLYRPMQQLCGPDICPILIANGLVYRDYDHLSVHGAELLARYDAAGREAGIPEAFWRAAAAGRAALVR